MSNVVRLNAGIVSPVEVALHTHLSDALNTFITEHSVSTVQVLGVLQSMQFEAWDICVLGADAEQSE
jgi:hypothetical protein